jgi:hypothetical protein
VLREYDAQGQPAGTLHLLRVYLIDRVCRSATSGVSFLHPDLLVNDVRPCSWVGRASW